MDIPDYVDPGRGINIVRNIFFLNQGPKKRKEILNHIDYANITKNDNKALEVLVKRELVAMTIPEKPTSSIQEYVLTKEGWELLRMAEG